MATPLGKNICFRLPDELRHAALAHCEALGVGLSELMRELLLRELGSPTIAARFDEGYMQGRRLAVRAMHQIVASAAEMLPETYEEAVARFGLAGPGVPDPEV